MPCRVVPCSPDSSFRELSAVSGLELELQLKEVYKVDYNVRVNIEN